MVHSSPHHRSGTDAAAERLWSSTPPGQRSRLACPLCCSTEIAGLERIATLDLIHLYERGHVPVKAEFGDCRELELYACSACDLRFFDPVVVGSASFYENLRQIGTYYYEDKNEFEFAKAFIESGDSVLDIGCGKGLFAKKLSTGRFTGLELNQKVIEDAEDSVVILNQSIEEHSESHPEHYDVVCAFQVLEHVADLRSFVNSSIKCLKRGGLLIYSVPSLDSFYRYLPNAVLELPPHHVTQWSDKCLGNIAPLFSLELVQLWHEPLDPVHKSLYAYTIILNALFNVRGIKRKTVDASFSTRLIGKISRFLGGYLEKGLVSADVTPCGASVTCVYRKPK